MSAVARYGRCVTTPTPLPIPADEDDDLGLPVEPAPSEAERPEAARADAIARLAGGIAHHLNNKLTVILGHAELARSELRRGSAPADDLDAIRAISLELAELAHQLLAVAGRGGLSVRPVELDRLVRANDRLLRAAAADGVDLRYQLADGIAPVAGDAGQLADALLQLVRHAGARTESGGTVVVRTREVVVDADHPTVVLVDGELAPGAYVALEVVAPGPIPEPSAVAGWFEPFASGLAVDEGLGLPAVLGIARGHRGGVQVVAERGAGTTFRVLVPVAQAAVTAPA
jgi:signal transduction histidine kinase